MRVAAYQMPLQCVRAMDAVDLIRTRVEQCEAQGVAILCCPEGILGGLADYSESPAQFAIAVGRLDSVLAPLASDIVTTIVGFSELADEGRLFNAAAVFHRGTVVGVYRKLHPAINRSVYAPGIEIPVFRVAALTFGIMICNDSNFSEPARRMAAQAATVLFVPTNNGLPSSKGGAELVGLARRADIARAVENGVWVVRADVAGRAGELASYGASGIVNPRGIVVQSARQMNEDLIVADVDTVRGRRRPAAR